MAHNPDNPFPVDPTGPLTIGSIPDEDLDRMIAATTPEELRRFRSAIAEVDPELLTASDIRALLYLIQAASESDSAVGQAIRAQEAAGGDPGGQR